MNLFIDTNVFLSFFHFSSDDLEEFNKLYILIREARIKLFIPEQLQDEFYRNRENSISISLNHLKQQKTNLQYPRLCQDYPEYDSLRELQKKYESLSTQLITKILSDIQGRKLRADKTIEELFQSGAHIKTTDKILVQATRREQIGNPPGKKGSLGDAIIWESLLSTVPDKEDLYFVTEDKDYQSNTDPDHLKDFLLNEWNNKKSSRIIFYKQLSLFFKSHYPEIRLASEAKKDLLIRDLRDSPNFATTHAIVHKLEEYADFTDSQVNAIIEACLYNSQVFSIIEDPDVMAMYRSIVSRYEEVIDPNRLDKLRGLFPKA